jgi:hypothetical protein
MERKILNPGHQNDSAGACIKRAFDELNDMMEEVYAGVLEVDFAEEVDLDANIFKDFRIGEITDDITINLNDAVDGTGGLIEVLMDGTGGYTVTLGAMFTKLMGGEIDTTASADNFIAWRKFGADILYNILTVTS